MRCIDANREIVERARTHVGNLAHALKTPLSVMVNEVASRGDDPLAAKMREQADLMRDQIARHLERARIAARTTVVAAVTDVAPVVTALARSMEKIHHDRGVAIDVDVPESARFRGERQDLEEMVGNLVDNACKWAQSRVAIEVVCDGRGPGRAPRGGAHRGRRRRRRPHDGRARADRAARTAASTKPSRARAWACRSWSSWPASMAAS